MVAITSARIRTEIGRQAQLSRDIARAQTEVSTGTRLQQASDDPVASARVAVIRRAQADEATWSANAQTGAATADRAETALTAVQTGLDRVKELMLRAASATTSASDRATISAELSGIREDVAREMGGTDTDGSPLFPTGEPLKLPVGRGETLTATASRAATFGDLDTVLGDALDALALTDDDARGTAVTASLEAIDGSASHLADARAAHGVRMQRLDDAKDRFADSASKLDEERGSLAGADVPSALAFIQQSLTQLSASQTMFARVSQQTLFDLLG